MEAQGQTLVPTAPSEDTEEKSPNPEEEEDVESIPVAKAVMLQENTAYAAPIVPHASRMREVAEASPLLSRNRDCEAETTVRNMGSWRPDGL